MKAPPRLCLILLPVVLGIGLVAWLLSTRAANVNARGPAETEDSADPAARPSFSSRGLRSAAVLPGESETQTEPAPEPSPTPAPLTAASPARVSLNATEEPVDGPETTPGVTPVLLLENMRTLLHNYHSRYGGNPVGDNQEIARALNGANPGQVIFLNADDGLQLNGKGELMDSWGTPLFFHQISSTQTEIHSAGPDRQMWTPDDLVLK